MINTNVKKQYPVIRMPNGYPISSTMYNRGDLHGVIYNNDVEFDDVLLSNIAATSIVFANLNVSTSISSNTSSLSSLLANVTISKLINSTVTTTSNITADINFVQKVNASLLTSASLTGNINIPRLLSASLTAAGTTSADLTVTASASLLLDLYPSAAAAYSLRKLRTAYTGSAIRVRASISGAEGDVSFDINNTISESSTVTVTAAGTSGLSIGQQVTFSTFWNAGGNNQNVFVTIWYDQSENARNATQTTQANQPQIVNNGSVLNLNNKPRVNFNVKSLNFTGFGSDNFSLISVIKTTSLTEYAGYIRNIGSSFNGFKIVSRELTIWKSQFLKYTGTNESLTNSRRNNVNSISGSQYLENWIFPNNPALLYENNINKTVSSDTLSGWGIVAGASIGSLKWDTGQNGEFDIQEIIVYTTNETSNLNGINTNINTYYGIY